MILLNHLPSAPICPKPAEYHYINMLETVRTVALLVVALPCYRITPTEFILEQEMPSAKAYTVTFSGILRR